MNEGSLSTSRSRSYQCQRQRASWMRRGPSTYWPTLGRESWTGTPWGGGVGVWFNSRLYYPFSKGPGQHIIWCLENKKCENENQAALNPPFFVKKKIVCGVLFVYRSLSTDSMSLLCKRRVYDFQGPDHCRKLSKLSELLCFHCSNIRQKRHAKMSIASQKRPVTR